MSEETEKLTNREELSFFTVFAFPNASRIGLAWRSCCSSSPYQTTIKSSSRHTHHNTSTKCLVSNHQQHSRTSFKRKHLEKYQTPQQQSKSQATKPTFVFTRRLLYIDFKTWLKHNLSNIPWTIAYIVQNTKHLKPCHKMNSGEFGRNLSIWKQLEIYIKIHNSEIMCLMTHSLYWNT